MQIKTENKKYLQLTERLHHTHLLVKNIIESTNVGAWEWNIETGEMIFSDKWAEIMGYNSLDELGQVNIETLEKITHPEDFKKSSELVKRHFANELPYYKHENRIKHKDGHWVWVCERGCVTARTDDGRPLLMFGTHTDITKRKQIEQALENYINTLNHDLRSPLSIILGYSSNLMEEDLSKDEVKKYAQIINSTGKKMLKMMESYLSLAKIERGQDILIKIPKTIKEISEDIIKKFEELKKDNKLKLKWQDLEENYIDESFPNKTVLIDEILFDSLINNLLHNAIEASHNADDKIIINIYDNCDELCLSFYNNGEISSEIQKKLFKKFISSKKNGTGIGLYSARLIARAHGGDIEYYSISGGTRFVLKIPL